MHVDPPDIKHAFVCFGTGEQGKPGFLSKAQVQTQGNDRLGEHVD